MILIGSSSLLSLPSRGAWIEIEYNTGKSLWAASLPSRGAWIEITLAEAIAYIEAVAPLAGSVDRNSGQAKSELVPESRSPRGERG